MSDPSQPKLEEIDAMVLAGGLGTRLKEVLLDKPKCLAEIRGQPFLAHFIDRLAQQGIRHVVLCTGHLGDRVQDAIGPQHGEVRISYSRETFPLGTGGALRLALPLTRSDPILALNGDSFCDADLQAFLDFHREKDASVSIVLTQVQDAARYGQVRFDGQHRVTHFDEKGAAAGPGWINAGIYLISRSLLKSMPVDRPISIEKESFPAWIGKGLYAWPHGGRFSDIGTPESYREAQDYM